jgi:DNA polymerase-3 subunit delta'
LFDLTLAQSRDCHRAISWRRQPLLQRLAQDTDTASSWHSIEKAIQYKAQCEQPLNSRLFLEEFFLSYARLFRTS